MANVYYTCNLIPPALVSWSGASLQWLGDRLQDATAPVSRDALGVHPMTCPYVTRLVTAAESVLAQAAPEDCVVVPGGCDAMRRLGDLLSSAYPGRVYTLSVPRSSTAGARSDLAEDLAAFEGWLRHRQTGGTTAAAETSPRTENETQQPATTHQGPQVEYPDPLQAGGVFVVAGPLNDDSLLRLIDRLGVGVSGLESCTSPDRWEKLSAGLMHNDDVFQRMAALVLDEAVCPRRSTLDRRKHLAHRLDEARPSSIIYARQSFCDPGAYDALEVARLADERGLPFLELEVGFPFEVSGPLRTRVEAFLEAQSLDDDLLDDLLEDDLLEDGLLDDSLLGEEG